MSKTWFRLFGFLFLKFKNIVFSKTGESITDISTESKQELYYGFSKVSGFKSEFKAWMDLDGKVDFGKKKKLSCEFFKNIHLLIK